MSVKRHTAASEPLPDWAALLNDYYGAGITGPTAHRWWLEMTAGPAAIRTDEAELCNAIRHHANDPNAKDYGKPSLKDLRIWVFVLRKASRGESSYAADPGNEEWLNSIKYQIRKRVEDGDIEAAWNVLCSPEVYAGTDRTTTADECRLLEAWAEQLWPRQWHRPRFTPSLSELFAQVAEAQEAL